MTPNDLINLIRRGSMKDLNAVLTKLQKKNPEAYELLGQLIQQQYNAHLS